MKTTVERVKPIPKGTRCPRCKGTNLSEDGGLGVKCYDCGEFVLDWGSDSGLPRVPGTTQEDAWEREEYDDNDFTDEPMVM